jgi:GTP cyclohydrolase II
MQGVPCFYRHSGEDSGLYNSSKPFESLFREDGQLAVDRALAELRAGRPVVIEAAGELTVLAALDAVAPSALSAFTRPGGGGKFLALSPDRAKVLGLNAGGPVAIPIEGLDNEAVYRLAAGVDAPAPANWEAAEAAAAAGIELCKHALLLPAVLLSSVGSRHALPASIYRVTLEQVKSILVRPRYELEIVSRAQVPLSDAGEASFVVFRGGPALRDQVAIVVGHLDQSRPVLVRVHSACLTGDLFGSLRCDCGDQLRNALAQLATEEGGILLYLDQEGRGTGIRNKMRAYALQDEGLDTIDADATLGYSADERRYEIAASMLAKLGCRRIRLLTNNPDKVAGLQRAGIDVVGRRPLLATITEENQSYLSTKVERAGHLLNGYLRSTPSADGARGT